MHTTNRVLLGQVSQHKLLCKLRNECHRYQSNFWKFFPQAKIFDQSQLNQIEAIKEGLLVNYSVSTLHIALGYFQEPVNTEMVIAQIIINGQKFKHVMLNQKHAIKSYLHVMKKIQCGI